MSGVYTFGEVKEKLGITSKELNDLMASSQLNPVRHEGSLKFQQADVERIKKQKDHEHLLRGNQPSGDKKYYSWDEALTKLQIENEDLQRFIEDGDIQAHQEGGEVKFSCEEIDRWISTLMDDKTIVMPGSSGDIVVEDEEAMSLAIPTNLGSPSISIPQKETYSLDQTLRELQLEEESLEKMVENGEIETLSVGGEIRYVQEDVDKYRQQKQADQTIVMPSNQELVVEEDDDDFAPIVIPAANTGTSMKIDFSATPDNKIDNLYTEPAQPAMVISPEESIPTPVVAPTPIAEVVAPAIEINTYQPQPKQDAPRKEFTKSFYTLAEVAQELEVDPDELMEIIKSHEIKTYRMNKLKNIKRSDLLKLCSMQFVQNSMQVPNKPTPASPAVPETPTPTAQSHSIIPQHLAPQMHDDDDDDDAADAIPIQDLASSINEENSKPKPKYENTIVLPLVDDFAEENEQAKKVYSPKVTPPVAQQGDPSMYYSFAEALNLLQMEKEDLDRLLNQGTLSYTIINGVKSLLKKEVTDYKTNKMIEPTIMMDDSGDDVLEEENDDDIFFIS
ncbi:helix-turn-helix domain-containing protein [Candidatus Uabimicrobium amorphum]|uniref:Helix-turn-helix domain-containing protein n=1 Tax=Uabimicrobium amorphum TaxID=2596890 RepID=A0A5S9IIT9_UABAM|nr:helix-turn-helix domain-containing protein [Candidatus Uabimicrobium amorphum]BBM81840.1 hypothetical protein UABAM_00180 [Candidatus Uabimicrobium amorphum]